MDYRKIAADKLFDGRELLEQQVLVVTEQGRIADVLALRDAGDNIEKYRGIISPGFVNCHCHLELSHMKGLIPEGTGLVDFVFAVVTKRGAREEEMLEAIARAEADMKAAGIVAVGDICNNSLTLSQKQKGNLRYYNFIEASGWLPAVSQLRFERAMELYKQFRQHGATGNNGHTNPASIVPHAPYSVSDDLWAHLQPCFQDKVVTIHNQETAFEDEFFLQGTGDISRMYELMKLDNSHHRPTQKSSLQSYFTKLAGAENALLVHNTFTTQSDVDFVKQHSGSGKARTFFCLCPNANLYIEGAMPPVALFRKNGCAIVLGTDSLASNWGLSVLAEIKTLRANFADVPLAEMLGWATINGATALGMEQDLGSFEKGKKPGAVLINEESLTVEKILF